MQRRNRLRVAGSTLQAFGDNSYSVVYASASSTALSSSSSDSSSLHSLLRSSSRPVAIAKLIVAETMAVCGVHLSKWPSFLSFDHPPRAYDRSPQRLAANLLNSWRRLLQRGQRNKK